MSFITHRQFAAVVFSKLGHAIRRPDLTNDECERVCRLTLEAHHLDVETKSELKKFLLVLVALLAFTINSCSMEKLNPLRTNRLLSTVHNVTAPPADGGTK
jgi:hypothetical protein